MFQENSKFKIDWQGPQSHSLEGGAGGWAQGPGSPAQATGGAGEMTCPLTTWGLHLPVAPTPAGQGPGVVTLTVAFSGLSPWTGQASRGECWGESKSKLCGSLLVRVSGWAVSKEEDVKGSLSVVGLKRPGEEGQPGRKPHACPVCKWPIGHDQAADRRFSGG